MFKLDDRVIDKQGRISVVTERDGEMIELDNGRTKVWGNKKIRESFIKADDELLVRVENKIDMDSLIKHGENHGFKNALQNPVDEIELPMNIVFNTSAWDKEALIGVSSEHDVHWPSDYNKIMSWFVYNESKTKRTWDEPEPSNPRWREELRKFLVSYELDRNIDFLNEKELGIYGVDLVEVLLDHIEEIENVSP